MSFPLNQAQVDNLIDGNEIDKKAQIIPLPYSFRRPPSLPKSSRAFMDATLATFAQTLGARLTTHLRADTSVAVLSVEQVTYPEFVLSLPNPAVAFVFTPRRGSEASGVIEIGLEFSFLCIDRLLGNSVAGEAMSRPLTQLEQTLMTRISREILDLLKDAWEGFTPIQPNIRSFESNPKLLEASGEEDSILALMFQVEAENQVGVITIGLPMASVRETQSVIEKVGRPPVADLRASLAKSPLGRGLCRATLDVSVHLAPVALSTRTVSDLKPGDVLDTGHRTDLPVEVHLNGRPRYVGFLGQVGRRLGLKISDVVNDSADERRIQHKRGKVK